MNIYKKIGVALLLFFNAACSKIEDKILPERRNLIESVYSSVIVQPDSLYEVYSVVAGLLEKNLVEEGELVSKNQALIQVINSAPKLNIQNARFTLDLAKEKYSGTTAILNGIRDEINAARMTLKNDSINYFRQKNLWEQSIGSEVQYDTKKLRFELSQNNLKLLRSKYNRTEKELQTAVKQANNNYQTSLTVNKDFTVKSAINGKVYALYKEPSEIVNTIEALAAVGSASDFVLELLVDEVDIVKIAVGQKILITLDAYHGEVFTGKVSKIYPQKDERNQTFTIEALFNNPPKTLYPGLSGEANIIVSQKEEALTLPKSYVVDGTKVITDDGVIAITIGLQNMEFVEILSGITENTYVHKPKE